MFFKKLFRRAKKILKRIFASTEVKQILKLTSAIRDTVENPSTALIADLTATDKDNKILAKAKGILEEIDIFKEITAKVKEKEDVDKLTYFIERIRGTKKNRRGAIYMAIASEIFKALNKKYSTSEANTVIQLAYSQDKSAK